MKNNQLEDFLAVKDVGIFKKLFFDGLLYIITLSFILYQATKISSTNFFTALLLSFFAAALYLFSAFVWSRKNYITEKVLGNENASERKLLLCVLYFMLLFVAKGVMNNFSIEDLALEPYLLIIFPSVLTSVLTCFLWISIWRYFYFSNQQILIKGEGLIRAFETTSETKQDFSLFGNQEILLLRKSFTLHRYSLTFPLGDEKKRAVKVQSSLTVQLLPFKGSSPVTREELFYALSNIREKIYARLIDNFQGESGGEKEPLKESIITDFFKEHTLGKPQLVFNLLSEYENCKISCSLKLENIHVEIRRPVKSI